MPTPLRNDRWGYESNCFVCEPANQTGLQIPFQLDDDATTVSATFRLGFEHSGAPALVHGGVTLALLDEAQAWACIAVAKKWALTHTTAATFDGPVFVDHDYRVEATITADGDKLETEARVLDVDHTVLVRSTATFAVLGDVDPEQAAAGLRTEHRRLLRE